MNWVDLLIVAVLAISAIAAFFNGIIVEAFSLGGLVLGIMVGSARYGELASHLPDWLERWTGGGLRDLIAFLLITVGIMLIAGLIGRVLRRMSRGAGLGFLDRSLGAVFGLIKGFVFVTLFVMAVIAFYPGVSWPPDSRLAPVFVRAAHDGSRVTAAEFGARIRDGVRLFRAPSATSGRNQARPAGAAGKGIE